MILHQTVLSLSADWDWGELKKFAIAEKKDKFLLGVHSQLINFFHPIIGKKYLILLENILLLYRDWENICGFVANNIGGLLLPCVQSVHTVCWPRKTTGLAAVIIQHFEMDMERQVRCGAKLCVVTTYYCIVVTACWCWWSVGLGPTEGWLQRTAAAVSMVRELRLAGADTAVVPTLAMVCLQDPVRTQHCRQPPQTLCSALQPAINTPLQVNIGIWRHVSCVQTSQ